jgi:hypothetical protein
MYKFIIKIPLIIVPLSTIAVCASLSNEKWDTTTKYSKSYIRPIYMR